MVRLQVGGPRKSIEFLRSEWSDFSTSSSAKPPDIFVRIESWNAERKLRSEADSQLRSSRGLRGCYKGYQWKATIDRSDSTTMVRYSAMPKSNFLLKDAVLEPLLLYRLHKKGVFGFHASAAEFAGKAWMICGPSKSGKTAMTLVGHRNGRPILSDDIALVSEGSLYPYPTPPRVYLRTLRRNRLLDGLLPGDVLARLIVNGIVGFATLGQVRVPTRLTSGRLRRPNRDTTGPMPLGGLILLRVGMGAIGVEVARNDGTLRDALASHQSEHASSFLNSFPGVVADTSQREAFVERLIASTAKANRCICVTLRSRMPLEDWDALFLRVERCIMTIESGAK